MKKISALLLSLIIALLLGGCNNEPEEITNPLTEEDFIFESSYSEDIELVTSINGIDINWKSSNSAIEIVGNTGVLTRGEEPVNVVLTARYSYGGENYMLQYIVQVEEKEETEEIITVSVITLNVTLPYPLEEGQTLSIGSNLNLWDPTHPDYVATKITDTTYQLVLELSDFSGRFLYKWTIQGDSNHNSWDQVERDSDGIDIMNRGAVLEIGEHLTLHDTVGSFIASTSNSSANLLGKLDIIPDFEIPQIDLHDTTIRVWTPSTYDPDDNITKYPVIYMHDGQNLFDPATSYAGEWGIDETIEAFIANSTMNGAIVVGIDNSGQYRLNTYTPEWDGPGQGINPNYQSYYSISEVYGERYGRFIVETLKPYIDANYNTLTGREYTSLAGSSMGGLISFYIGLNHMDVFGSIGVFSPSFLIASEEGRHSFIDSLDFTSGNLPRVYIDAGSLESSIKPYVDIVAEELYNAGLPQENLYVLIKSGQDHNEAAWKERFPNAFLWMTGSEVGNYIPREVN